MIRLIACDLDGTLMNEQQQIAPAVRVAIAEALAAGITVTLATGRMFTATYPFARQLGITAPLICYQGGWIQAADDPAPRFRATLPRILAEKVLQYADEAKWHTVLYADGHLFLRELRHPSTFYAALLGTGWTIVERWAIPLHKHQVDKVLFIAEAKRIPAIEQTLRRLVGEQATIVRSHAHFVEVIPRDVNKGRGVQQIAAEMGIPQAEVMAIGDRENDIPMLQWAGIGVAMGNAAPAVQAVADWIAPPLEHAGAAMAIRRFALRRR